MNPLKALGQQGQSVWLDYIRRGILKDGELARMVREDGLCGLTSNPAIFEKAIADSSDYDGEFKSLGAGGDMDAQAIFERLAIRDIQDAADIMRPVYDRASMGDGFVSLEVSPYLARDTQATIDEARRLWKAVARPNVMIKIPGTPEGLPAIERMIAEGVNINVTLLFSADVYEQVARAYVSGLEQLAAAGGDVARVRSVASFFVSRIDSAVDGLAAARLKTATGPRERADLEAVQGKVAIANARLAYQRMKAIFAGPRWEALVRRGAAAQRMLWASTSTKDPRYRDVVYIEELIGRDTVNTIPPATYAAFRDHGEVHPRLEADLGAAAETLARLERLGISFKDVCLKLVEDGVRLFADAFDKLLAAIERRRRELLGRTLNRMSWRVPEPLLADVKAGLDDWRRAGKVRRLWARDASLWTGADEATCLGWLGVTAESLDAAEPLASVAEDVRRAGFSHVLLLGMGGSSLCPDVLARTFGPRAGFPALHVLDSTDPAQIRACERRIDPARTLFVVASKSGSTLEPNILKAYFFERARAALGVRAGERFVAITDHGSSMQAVAESDGFRHVAFGVKSIGGRFSALSSFGVLPAALIGVDVGAFLEGTEKMVRSCAACVPPEENAGVLLGVILGTLARRGRDKLTLVTSPRLRALGGWLEQLVAESTGKDGKAIIPVDLERLGPPEAYGKDRVFAYASLEGDADPAQVAALEALERAGHPVLRFALEDAMGLGQEFFRWEIATATAGAILGINAFNQPDVEASKIATRSLVTAYEKTGSLPAEAPFAEEGGIACFADAKNASALRGAAAKPSLAGALRAHLARVSGGDYFALLAYVAMSEEHASLLDEIRLLVRNRRRVATCLGFGPRFLHSTGQAYKGGPSTGVFLQVTCDDAEDIPVPGQKYTFGIVKAAQARGDFQVLAERGRRALRVHLGRDVAGGLKKLHHALEEALG